MSRLLLALAVASLMLAGCGAPPEPGAGSDGSKPPIEAGKGAIAGLVIDDVFRPVPAALVLLQGTGLTATSDGAGQFTFTNLEPGAYIAIVSVEGHEAAPKNIDVKEGIYNPLEIEARRVVNVGGQILTAQYSIFMTCTMEAVIVSGNGINCFQDQSGDSERTGFVTDLTMYNDVTYLVTEIKFNKPDDYDFLIAWDNDGDSVLDDYWAELAIVGGDYGRIVLQAGKANTEAEKGRNLVWDPANRTFQTTVFPHGELYSVVNPATGAICYAGCGGVGVDLGIKANIVQSVFLGKPTVSIDTYHVL